MVSSGKKLFYKIGEACRICELEPHVLRYWETEFALLRPVKNRAGQRIYRHADLELIETIKHLLYEEGYTIAGANARLLEESSGKRSELPLFQESVLVKQRRAVREIADEIAALERLLARGKQ